MRRQPKWPNMPSRIMKADPEDPRLQIIRAALEAAAKVLDDAGRSQDKMLKNYIKRGGNGPATSFGAIYYDAALKVRDLDPAAILATLEK